MSRRKSSPRVQKTYNIELAVVEAFDEEVDDQTRSRLIEALMINWLVEYTRGVDSPNAMVGSSNDSKEIQ